ncbi:hypothetical protein M1146_02700 [Patescibacteria group bacterium]|nr:hypothetical protein [Patescibacteria group bacterium]
MPEAEGEVGVGAPITHDATRRVEIRDSRETVINAFNSAYSIFESCPEDKLTPQQQAARELIKDIREKTLDKGKASYLNRFESEDGEKFSQREYVPVDELILFLRDRVKSGELTAEDETEYKELEKILHRNSQEYYRGAEKKDYSRKMARITQESQRISSDSRLTKGNPHDDFLEAGRVLFGRRELIIPPSSTQPTPEPEPTPTSETTETTEAQPPTEGTSTTPLETTPEPETEEAAEPEPEPPEQVRREVMIVNRTLDVQKRARELADEQLRNEMRRGSFLNPLNWPRKIGLRIMEDFHRQRYIERASREMIANNNSYLSMDVVRNAAVDATHRLSEERQAGQAKIEQLRTGTLIEGQQTVEAQGELRTTIISEIIRPVVEGGITDQAQIQQRLREFVENHQDDLQVQAVFGRNANQFGRLAEYFATDLLETGEAIRGDLEAHRYSLDELDSLIQVRLANTSWAAETQVRLNTVDRAIAWAERHRLTGTLINPATIGAGFSIATFGLMRGLGFSARASQFIVPGAGLLPGALFAAARRNYDLKIDRASHQVERAYNMRIPQDARRREALEQLSYNTASVDQMINGGGQELLTGADRQSLEELLSQDLSEGQTSSREAVVRRITEIQSRLDFSSRERVDLVTYQSREQVEQGRLALINSVARSTQALRNSGMSNEEFQEIETRFTGQWNSRFTQNREQQDRAFAQYRLRNAAGAAVFGGVAGLAGGYALREAMERTGINPLGFAVERTSHAVSKFRELFRHEGQTQVGNYRFNVDANHNVNILDQNGGTIAHGSLGPDGNLHNVIAGDGLSRDMAQNFNTQLDQAGFVSQMHETTVISPSISDQVQEALAQHKPSFEVHQGNIDLLIQGQSGHVTIHDVITNTTLSGQASPDGTMAFPQADNPNIDLTAIHRDLTAAGFGVTEGHQTIDTAVNPIDHLLSTSPSELHTKGIIETDMTQKNWNFHVLRPDIVAATGEHTHNELTLHIGQGVDANGNWISDQKGLLNFGGDTKGDLIPSNLPGVPPMHDQVLDQLIANNGAIHHSDMVFVIDLNDGRQIMIGADNIGNAHLPQELFNPETGDIQGVKSIASAILEKDGHVLRAGSVLQDGTIPNGATVHSLASVALETPAPQPVPAEILNVTAPTAPGAPITHFSFDIIPPGESSEIPIIPFPWSPRHPLEPLGEPIVIPPPLPPTYYGGESLTEAQNWIATHPEAHRQYIKRRNPDGTETWVDTEGNPIVRDISKERKDIEKYLRDLELDDQSHYEMLQDLVTKVAPMKSETRVAINIPAWMEGKNLYRLLDQYTRQIDKEGHELNSNLYEINIIVNRKTGTASDNSVEEIERFKRDSVARGKNYNINYVDVEFNPPFNNVGNARRVITDLVLLRSLSRHSQGKPLYMESEDADLVNVDQRTVINLIDKLDQNPHLDAVRGIQDRLPEAMMKNDLLFLYRRVQDFKELLIRRGAYRPERNPNANYTWNRVITGGWNTGYTAQAYAMIGGYNPYQTKGEDMIMGERFSMTRGDGTTPNTEVVGKVSTRTDSSPRRYIYEVASGKAAYGPDFEDESVNQEIRDKTPEELMAKISNFARLNESNAETFARMLNSEYTFIKATTPNITEAQKVTGFVLSFLGLKKGDYEFKDESIEFKNWSNVQAALNNYRARHIAPRKEGERTSHKTSIS